MAQKIVSVELIRDGQCTPWGFRLRGGTDVGSPLIVERVFFGSPADGELRRGDIIARIRDVDATKISHKHATDLIAKAGNTINLVVARSGGPTHGSPSVSPVPILSAPGTPVIMYHLSSAKQSGNILPLSSPPGSEHLFRPLPTTQFGGVTQNEELGSAFPYQVHNWETSNEKVAITNQAYRTLPLISPGCKTVKDVPVGSYLRFSYDTKGHNQQGATSGMNQRTDAYMLSKVQEAVLGAASNSPRASVSSGRTPTPDMSMGITNGPQVYHRQYNSPINIYSNQAIMDTIASQTASVMKEQPTLGEALKDVIVEVASVLSDKLGGKASPKAPCDISKSPTYQLIHEEEWKDLNKRNLKEHRPVEDRVYNVVPPDSSGLNPFGIPGDKVHQSGSFKTLMTSMQGLTDF